MASLPSSSRPNHLLRLSELHIYPVKSAAGISVSSAQLSPQGLQFDRRCMVVSPSGQFMTQRRFPRMALIGIAFRPTTQQLTLSAPAMEPLSLPPLPANSEPASQPSREQIAVEVWGDRTPAISLGSDAQQWLSTFLKTPCQLVYMPESTRRPVDHGKLGPEHLVSFADTYPYLLLSEASLAELNQKLAQKFAKPVGMDRFRPNLVVRGDLTPHAEDDWTRIRIGEAIFSVAKPCARCSVPTVDQAIGEKVKGNEPIKTLSTYRSWDQAVWFGQNLVQENPDHPCTLRVGDQVEVLK